MDRKGSESVHYKYSKEELLTISKLELSLKKPEILKDECFNDNKRWSPELGFKAMLLESKHTNGNSTTKVDIKSEIKVDSTLPPLRPQLGGWGSGCIGMKPVAPAQPSQAKDTSPVRPVTRPAKIIIPPRPMDEPPQLGNSWRGQSRFDREKDADHRYADRRPWNEKPVVNRNNERYPNRNERFEPRYPQNHHNGRYRDEETFGDDADDPWDMPGDEPFDFEGLPGDNRTDDRRKSEEVRPKSDSPSPDERPPSQPNIPRSDSPDMESRMMSELLKIFDDSDVTEIPVVTNPGGSRILGLISQQDQYQPVSSFSDHNRSQNDYMYSNNVDQHHQSFQQRSMESGRSSNHFHGQQQQPDGGAVGNDLLQILQKAKINVNNLPNNPSNVPSLNVAQAKSLAEIESGISRHGSVSRSSPQQEQQQPTENHAFNKLLEMMNSSRTRTENSHQQQQFPQQRLSSYELERLHEEKKRMEQQQQQMVQEARRDSLGSTPHSFVPIQVMRQARGHFQEQLPRPVVGRTGSNGSPAFPGQQGAGNPFAPRMGLSDVEIRQLAQIRAPVGGMPRPGVGRNSPVNLLQQQQQQFMIPPQMRGPYPPGGHINQQLFGPHSGLGLRPSQLPVGAPGQPRGGMPIPNHIQQQFQSRGLGPQQSPTSQSQGPMNLQQLQMLNQHLHSLPPHQLSEMSRGMTNEQLNQMLLRASHQ